MWVANLWHDSFSFLILGSYATLLLLISIRVQLWAHRHMDRNTHRIAYIMSHVYNPSSKDTVGTASSKSR